MLSSMAGTVAPAPVPADEDAAPRRKNPMKRIALVLVAAAAVAGAVASLFPGSGHADEMAVSTFLTEIPAGYRDWRWISLAHEEGDFHSFAAVLGNDVAIKAYRDGKLPFPDGTIIAALHYRHVVASPLVDQILGTGGDVICRPRVARNRKSLHQGSLQDELA